MADIACTLGCAAREDQHVAVHQCLAHGLLKPGFIVGNGAAKVSLAAIFRNGRADNGSIGVIDAGGRQRLARLDKFIARRKDSHARLARHLDAGDAAGGEHANFARADQCAGAQQHFAASHIGTGIGNGGPGDALRRTSTALSPAG